MLVNSQKYGQLGQGCGKDWTHKFCLTPQTLKNSISQQPHSNLGWQNAPYQSRTYAARPEASFSDRTRQGDQIWEPVTPTCDTHQRPKSLSTTVSHTEMTPLSGHLGSLPGPTHYYRVVCRKWEQAAAGQGLSSHPVIHKSKPQASKKKIYEFHKLLDVYNTSSSSRSALALVLLLLQHSHIALEVTYIHISNIYIYIFAFWHHRLVSYSRTTGLLVCQYFYFCTKYSLLCARVVALSEKRSIIQYDYRKWGTHARAFSKHLHMLKARKK